MIKNYFKIFIRSSWRNVGFTSINLIGLSLGIASCLMITIFVLDELSFDNFHDSKGRIFRVISERHSSSGMSSNAYVPNPFSVDLLDRYPEVEEELELTPAIKRLFSVDDVRIYEDNGYYAGDTFWEFFNTSLIIGNTKTALRDVRSIVITEKLAIKYFGPSWLDQDILSKSITINSSQDYKITGVMKELPSNFHLDFDFLISNSTYHLFLSEYDRNNWLSPRNHFYLRLNSAASKSELESKLGSYISQNVDSKTEEYGFEYEFKLQPLEDIHLYSASNTRDSAKRGNILHVTALAIIAGIILLLACANFVNLSTARAFKRSKEVGLRKTVGAKKVQIAIQFLGEAILFSLVSMVLGALIVEITLPLFNSLFNKSISLNLMDNAYLLLITLGILLFTGILAGSYSAFYLSSFQPVKVLRKQSMTKGLSGLRKTLVVFQFSMSAALIMATMVMVGQLKFLQSKDVGFDKDELVVFPIRGKELRANLESFKSRVSQYNGIKSVAATSGLPAVFVQGDDIIIPEQQELLPTKMILADVDFIKTLDIEVLAGRSFSREYTTDSLSAFVINESAAKEAGWTNEEAVGKNLEWDIWVSGDTTKRGQVIGVVKDFHYLSMEQKIGPVVIHQYAPEYSFIVAKVSRNDIESSLSHLKKEYETYATKFPFEYHFLDEDFAAQYKSQSDFVVILQVFAGLAIVIACLGLIGLSAFSTEQQKKEISIRKVYGASITQLLLLINNQFMRLILLAIVIALPIGYYVTNSWLNSYAYKIETVLPQLISAGLISFVLAIASVSYLVFRAAIANPAEVLRSE